MILRQLFCFTVVQKLNYYLISQNTTKKLTCFEHSVKDLGLYGNYAVDGWWTENILLRIKPTEIKKVNNTANKMLI